MIEETLSHESSSLSQLFNPGMRVVLVIGVVLAVLQQVTEINVFLYFGSESALYCDSYREIPSWFPLLHLWPNVCCPGYLC